MKQQDHFCTWRAFVFFLLFFIIVLAACGGRQATPSEPAAAINEPALNKKYETVLIQRTEIDPQFVADYPTAVAEYDTILISELRSKAMFRKVDMESSGGRTDRQVLLVKSRVLNLRVVSGSARFWVGPMAGSSDMTVEIKLLDGNTGQVLRERVLSTANNPFAAMWVGGSSDRSLPADMGKIAATYIIAIMPKYSQDMKDAGSASEGVSAPVAKEQVEDIFDDTTITEDVTQKLADASALKGSEIEVNTADGVVTLTGVVKTRLARTTAAKVAKAVKGVKSVVNKITIGRPAPKGN